MLSLTLSLSLSSPFFSLALSSAVLGNRSRAESVSAGRKGKEGQGRGSSRIYEGEGERAGDETGKIIS